MYDVSSIGKRIRLQRSKMKLTQNELAERLYVSFQAVSSWENGVTAPDIENLCRLALVFNIPVDSLLQNDGGSVMLAVDGGGTKSEFVLFTSEGRIVERFKLAGTNAAVGGIDSVVETLREGIDRCIKARVDISSVFIGTAGPRLDEIESRLSAVYSGFRIKVESDGVNALFCEDAEAALICGTGSILILKEGDGIRRLGGWGYMVGDDGSAFNIGREALRVAARAKDGATDDTVIYGKILARLGCDKLRNTPFSRSGARGI